MEKVLVIVEGAGEGARELAAAARSLDPDRVEALWCIHEPLAEAVAELARSYDAVHLLEDPAFQVFDGDLAARAAAAWLAADPAEAVLLAHTNLGLELAPGLAARLEVPMLADCLELELRDGRVLATRAVYGGKLHARVAARPGARGWLATLRPGAWQAPEAEDDRGGEIRHHPLPEGLAPRRQYLETVAPEPGAVDITQAEVLVAVGRGIEEEENLELVRPLVAALGAELACTRPVVDRGWLEKSRQVGTSGRTVRPKAYLALGISGSFQHLGGLQGRPFLAAINKDPKAPIFAVADVGIVGDVLELVPLLTDKIRERKE